MSSSDGTRASVITEFDVPAVNFELGRVLGLEPGMVAAIETVVATDEIVVPYLWVTGDDHGRLFERVGDHPTVEDVLVVDSRGDRTLYAVEWAASDDPMIAAISEEEADVLWARGTESTWTLVVRFPSYDSFVSFKASCRDAAVTVRVTRLYNRTTPEAGPWFGLTDRQRETLALAVERGYYDIPRAITTLELAGLLGIADQAVTERLRRGIATLVRNSVLVE